MRPFKLRLLTTVAGGVMRNPVTTGLHYADIYRDGRACSLEAVGGALALAWRDGAFNVDIPLRPTRSFGPPPASPNAKRLSRRGRGVTSQPGRPLSSVGYD